MVTYGNKYHRKAAISYKSVIAMIIVNVVSKGNGDLELCYPC